MRRSFHFIQLYQLKKGPYLSLALQFFFFLKFQFNTLQFGPLQQKFIRETISNNNPMDRVGNLLA